MKYSELSPEDQRHALGLVLRALTDDADNPGLIREADLEYEARNLDWIKNQDGTLEFEM